MPEVNQNSKSNLLWSSFKEVAVTTGVGAGVGLAAGTGISFLPGIGKSKRPQVAFDTFESVVRESLRKNDDDILKILPQTAESKEIIEKVKRYINIRQSIGSIEIANKLAEIDKSITKANGSVSDNIRMQLANMLPEGVQIPADDAEIANFIKRQINNYKNDNQNLDTLTEAYKSLEGQIKKGINGLVDNLKKIKSKKYKNTPDFDVMKHAENFYKTSVKGAAKSASRAAIIGACTFAGILAMLTLKIISNSRSANQPANNTVPAQNVGTVQG